MIKNSKRQARLRRAKKLREQAKHSDLHRLCIHRTSQHIYAQLIDVSGARTLVTASSLKLDNGGNINAAKKVGQAIGKAAKKVKIDRVIFDRSPRSRAPWWRKRTASGG